MVETGAVSSIRAKKSIALEGFNTIDEKLEMFRWFRRGDDVTQFIVADVERELYEQDSNAQLLSVICTGEPIFKTTALKVRENDTQAIVSECSVVINLTVIVRASDGVLWQLTVDIGYAAANLNRPDDFSLQMNFDVIGSSVIDGS